MGERNGGRERKRASVKEKNILKSHVCAILDLVIVVI